MANRNRLLPRFWSVRDKEYIYWDCYMQTAFNRSIEPNTYGLMYNLYKDSVNYVSEMPTGLRDKKGKLIYEGDIVKQYDRHNRLKRIGWIVYNELEMKFKIETNHDEWSEKTESYSFFPLKQKLEVIGNIYENAELLND